MLKPQYFLNENACVPWIAYIGIETMLKNLIQTNQSISIGSGNSLVSSSRDDVMTLTFCERNHTRHLSIPVTKGH